MAALHESERRLSLVTTQAPAYIWATDRHLTVTYLSLPPGRAERWVGKPLGELFANTSAGYAEHIDALAGRSLAFQAERSGRSYESRLEPLRGIDGEIIGCVGVAFDITERKEAEERIQHLAHYDVLTGLPNRALLGDRLLQALARAGREHAQGTNPWVSCRNHD